MGLRTLDGASIQSLFDKYRSGSTLFETLDPPNFGTYNDDAEDEVAEIASLLYAIDQAGDRFRIVSLGAAPGEWSVKAERGYVMRKPDGDFQSINLEGDLDHVDMTNAFMARNGANMAKHSIRYQVIADRDGFAYFPIINPELDWGAGIAAVSENADDLDQNITIDDAARADRVNANGGKPLEFRTVEARSLETLLSEIGIVDYLHCDIQGAEKDVFPGQLAAMGKSVKLACIATHAHAIEAVLVEAFEAAGWTPEGYYPCFMDEAGRTLKDGVYIWSNPKLAGIDASSAATAEA